MEYDLVAIHSDHELEAYMKKHWKGPSGTKHLELRIEEAKAMCQVKFANQEPLVLRDSAVEVKELLSDGISALFSWQQRRRQNPHFKAVCNAFEHSDPSHTSQIQCDYYSLSYQDIMPDAFNAWCCGVIDTYDLMNINSTLLTLYEYQFISFFEENNNPLQFFDILNKAESDFSDEAKKYLLPYFTAAKTSWDRGERKFKSQIFERVVSEKNIEKIKQLQSYQRQFSIITLPPCPRVTGMEYALQHAHNLSKSLVIDEQKKRVGAIVPFQISSIILNPHEFPVYFFLILGEIDFEIMHKMAFICEHPDIYGNIRKSGSRVFQLYDVNTKGPTRADNTNVSPLSMQRHDGTFHWPKVSGYGENIYNIFIEQSKKLRLFLKQGRHFINDDYLDTLDDFFGVTIFLDWIRESIKGDKKYSMPKHTELLCFSFILMENNVFFTDALIEFILDHKSVIDAGKDCSAEIVRSILISPLKERIEDIKRNQQQENIIVMIAAVDFIMSLAFKHANIGKDHPAYINYAKLKIAMQQDSTLATDVIGISTKERTEGKPGCIDLTLFDCSLPNGDNNTLTKEPSQNMALIIKILSNLDALHTLTGGKFIQSPPLLIKCNCAINSIP